MADDDRQTNNKRPPVATIVTAIIVVALLIALAVFMFGRQEIPEPAPSPDPAQPAVPQEEEEPPQPEPEPEPSPQSQSQASSEPEAEPEPLPELGQSDAAVRESALEVLGSNELANLLVSDEIVRKFVRAVNAADEGRVVHEYRPLLSPPPPLEVEPIGDATVEAEQEYRISRENYRRYDPYVELLTSVNPETMANWYERFSPLLERAFGEHGADKGSFHSVLLESIDQVLAAPEPEDQVILMRPKVFYEFQDPDLEALPDTHKLMIRMGPDNREAVKRSLRAIRDELQRLTL